MKGRGRGRGRGGARGRGDGGGKLGVLARRAMVWVIVAAAFYPTTGCRRTKSPGRPPEVRPRLGLVEVREITSAAPDTAPLDVEAVAAVIRRTLLQSGLFQNGSQKSETDGDGSPSGGRDAGGPPGAVVRAKANVAVELAEVDEKGVVRTAVRVKLDTRPSDAPGAVDDDLSAGGERLYAVTATTDRGRLAQESVERTVTDLLGGFVARSRLRTATAAEIHAAITADGGTPGLREEAIRTIGERRLQGEAPLLLTLLQHDNEAIRDAALGALIALKDRRAVAVLTRSRSLRDRHEMRKILDAIAILGGDEARDYLSFVAESHDDDEIRKLAVDAKSRLERRGDASGAGK